MGGKYAEKPCGSSSTGKDVRWRIFGGVPHPSSSRVSHLWQKKVLLPLGLVVVWTWATMYCAFSCSPSGSGACDFCLLSRSDDGNSPWGFWKEESWSKQINLGEDRMRMLRTQVKCDDVVEKSVVGDSGEGQTPSTQAPKQPPSRKPFHVFVYDLPAQLQLKLDRLFYEEPKPNLTLHLHSAEYWILSDLLGSKNSSSTLEQYAAIAVDDPAIADVFLVPFLSSQSRELCHEQFEMHREACHGIDDFQRQEEVLQWVTSQRPWQESGGFDHVFMLSHPFAISKYRFFLRSAIFLTATFDQFCHNEVSLDKDVIIPHQHVLPAMAEEDVWSELGNDSSGMRPTLLHYMGLGEDPDDGVLPWSSFFSSLSQASDVELMEKGDPADLEEGWKEEAAEKVRRSKFCLCPILNSRTSTCIWDAIVNLCVPVVIADHIELPFEGSLDWRKVVVFMSKQYLSMPYDLLKNLRRMRDARYRQLQTNLGKLRHYFMYEEAVPSRRYPVSAVDLIWKEVALKRPYIQLMVNRHKRNGAAVIETKDFRPWEELLQCDGPDGAALNYDGVTENVIRNMQDMLNMSTTQEGKLQVTVEAQAGQACEGGTCVLDQ